MSPELPESVVEAIAAGRSVEAIKRLREATGMSLADAKAAIDRYATTDASDQEPSAEVLAALAAGRKLEAIKLFRDQTGVGLRDARIRIEALQKTLPDNPSTSSTGGLRSLLSLLVAIAVLVAVYAWLTSP